MWADQRHCRLRPGQKRARSTAAYPASWLLIACLASSSLRGFQTMKRVWMIAIALCSSTALAQESHSEKGSFGLRVNSSYVAPIGPVNTAEGRFFLTDDLALDLGLGFQLEVAG